MALAPGRRWQRIKGEEGDFGTVPHLRSSGSHDLMPLGAREKREAGGERQGEDEQDGDADGGGASRVHAAGQQVQQVDGHDQEDDLEGEDHQDGERRDQSLDALARVVLFDVVGFLFGFLLVQVLSLG